ncbi:MAG: hypothetical protein U9O89_05270 [Thermoproteota archaeon]|nr:hypothetical protein [Thermoproteota archaeon]
MKMPKVWNILNRFKDECQSRGWMASQKEDWVKTGEEYHNFLWARNVHPSTFEKVTSNQKCAVQEDKSYRVVDVAYTAWLFPENSPEDLIQTLKKNPKLSKRTAIYDLSWAYQDKPVCLKLNETSSSVFEEFERFLEKTWGVKVKPHL